RVAEAVPRLREGIALLDCRLVGLGRLAPVLLLLGVETLLEVALRRRRPPRRRRGRRRRTVSPGRRGKQENARSDGPHDPRAPRGPPGHRRSPPPLPGALRASLASPWRLGGHCRIAANSPAAPA